MQRKLRAMLIFLLIFVLIPSVMGVCTVTFDKSNYAPGETSTASMQCSANDERNRAYALTWYNQSGQVQQNDTGTTPAVIDQFFFETFLIPGGITAGSARLIGTSLEGSDNFTVSPDANALLITLISITDTILLGKTAGAEFSVNDSNNNSVNGALCEMSIQDGGQVPVGSIFTGILTYDGVAHAAGLVSGESLQENTDNLMSLHCNYDSTGDGLVDKTGDTSTPFTVGKWLNVSAATNKNDYIMGEEIFICANITDLTEIESVHMHLVHQLRCSADAYNDQDTDRSLILSDDDEHDHRGVTGNTSQMQCKRFIIPESRYMQGNNNTCVATVDIAVYSETHDRIVTYVETKFNISIYSNTLELNADWESLTTNRFETTINLSEDIYADYNGSGMGTLDIRLDISPITIKSSDQYIHSDIHIEDFVDIQNIKSVVTKDCNGTILDNKLEFLNDGYIEIEIENVLIERSGCYEAEILFEKNTGGKMIAVILTFMMLSLFFFGLAYVQSEPDMWANRIRWAGIIMSFLQVFMMIGAIYGDFAGLDITPLLRADMWIVLLLGFGMLMITLYMKTTKLMDLSDTNNDKWK